MGNCCCSEEEEAKLIPVGLLSEDYPGRSARSARGTVRLIGDEGIPKMDVRSSNSTPMLWWNRSKQLDDRRRLELEAQMRRQEEEERREIEESRARRARAKQEREAKLRCLLILLFAALAVVAVAFLVMAVAWPQRQATSASTTTLAEPLVLYPTSTTTAAAESIFRFPSPSTAATTAQPVPTAAGGSPGPAAETAAVPAPTTSPAAPAFPLPAAGGVTTPQPIASAAPTAAETTTAAATALPPTTTILPPTTSLPPTTTPAPTAKCPGSFFSEGFGEVTLINAGADTPGVKTGKVAIKDGRTVIPQMGGRTYFGTSCTEGAYDRSQYMKVNMIGKKVQYTIDLWGTGCGCNAAFYLVSMASNPQRGKCGDYYCDAMSVCGVPCAEIDMQEAGQHAWLSTLHAYHYHWGPDKLGALCGYGGNYNIPNRRDWTSLEYGPGAKCIDTNLAFNVTVSFPAGPGGSLAGMSVALTQKDHDCPIQCHIDSYTIKWPGLKPMHGRAELTEAFKAGMTPVISYWSSSEMLWMDGPGTDLEGPCKVDAPKQCASLVMFYGFHVETMVVPTTTTSTPAPTTTSTPTPSPLPTQPPVTQPPITQPPVWTQSSALPSSTLPPTTTTSHSKVLHGGLLVKGNQIVSAETGQPVQLRGMSFFWSQWMGKFWNADVVQWLKNDWHVTVLRCAMGVEQGGYLENPAREKAKLEVVVRAAIAAGIYVLIDWHDYNAHQHVNEAKAFFDEMAQRYGSYPNVLFETFNEPMQVGWADTIKPYHEQIVPVIRQHTSNLIILGTRMWSQMVDEAAMNPVAGINLAYTIHFYAASMGQELRNKVSTALTKGVAIFATEWGTCEYTGNGALNLGETQAWLDFFKQNHISNINWAISDKSEACSALAVGADKRGGWAKSELTPSGMFVRKSLRAEPAVEPMPSVPETTTTTTTTLPQASNFRTVILTGIALATGMSLVLAAVLLAQIRKGQGLPASVACCLDTRAPSAQNLLAVGGTASQANSPNKPEGV